MLKGPLSGWSSRRINDEHRLIYRVRGGDLEIAACHGHYLDK
nr:type II toxin-antitoxin system YoeB family toxin [Actinoplanes flavus]